MKITNKNSIRDVLKRNHASTSKNTENGLFSLFSSELTTKQHDIDHYNHDISELRVSVDTAGALLEHEPTLQNFKHFRDVLSRLAKRVSSEAYCLEKIGGTPMNPRYYEIITVINKEADKLFNLIVTEQKDRMAITASVIGIKGLVVDLVT